MANLSHLQDLIIGRVGPIFSPDAMSLTLASGYEEHLSCPFVYRKREEEGIYSDEVCITPRQIIFLNKLILC